MPPITQEEIDINKQKVIANITNIDCKKEFSRLLKQYKIEGNFISRYSLSKSSSNHIDTLYGDFWNGKINPYKKPNLGEERYIKNGIEILGMKPSVKTADGKFQYKGVSIKELKQSCKENGLKKYSSCDKVGLVKLLMTI